MSEDRDTSASLPDGRCGDAAIYLLGLLDERQRARFLAHAEACAVCRDELGALRPAVDVLPATVPQLGAPEHVKRRVMDVVRTEARHAQADASREGGSRGGVAREGGSLGGVAREGGLWAGASRAQSGLLGRWWPSQRTRRPALALAAAGLLAGGVAIGALAVGAGSSGTATRVVSADVTIAGASAALHESTGHDWLTAAGLPQPRAGRVYEIWVKHPGRPPQPTSSLFSPTRAGTATVAVPSELGGGSLVMVTQEPAGGSALPTSAPVIIAHLS
jgi:hypothetical protein